MDARNYARVDFRSDLKGKLYILEINSTPAVCYPPNKYGVGD
jgi:D-alanine-D-alanine ligase-like ATP-grasp enzyme